MNAPIRLVLTGAESSGKSTLASWLSKRLHVPLAAEYARLFLEFQGPEYDEDLVHRMAREHLLFQRDQVPPEVPLGIFDTDLINYKIWCEVAYGRVPDEIIKGMQSEQNHLYLLCYPDLPWEPDPLREYPRDRQWLYEKHEAEIKALGRPHVVVRGLGEARFASVLQGIQYLGIAIPAQSHP